MYEKTCMEWVLLSWTWITRQKSSLPQPKKPLGSQWTPSGKELPATAVGSHCVCRTGGASDDSRAPALSSHVYIQYHDPWDLKHWEISAVLHVIRKMTGMVPYFYYHLQSQHWYFLNNNFCPMKTPTPLLESRSFNSSNFSNKHSSKLAKDKDIPLEQGMEDYLKSIPWV